MLCYVVTYWRAHQWLKVCGSVRLAYFGIKERILRRLFELLLLQYLVVVYHGPVVYPGFHFIVHEVCLLDVPTDFKRIVSKDRAHSLLSQTVNEWMLLGKLRQASGVVELADTALYERFWVHL